MWTHWRSHFETNARRPLPGAPADIERIPAAWRGPLCASLARFQLGESGEGRVAREIDRAQLPGIDADYRASLKLFVKEEGRHARILAGMVRALGGSLLHHTWSERLFVAGRRLLGLRLKLLVLLAAEVIGLGFYALIERRLGACTIGEQLREIAEDERAHLEFHAAFFRGQVHGVAARWLFRATWWSVAGLACAMVLFDHRRTLAAMDIPLGSAARRMLELLVQVDLRVLGAADRRATAPPGVTVAQS